MEEGGGGEGNDNEVPGDAVGEGSKTRQREEKDEEEDWSEQRCGLCGKSGLEGKEGLYRHYAYQHYKSRLFELLGENKKECPFCEHQFEFMAEIPGHIGYHHSKVEDFLPQHLHVKASSPAQQAHKPSVLSGSQSVPDRTRDKYSCGLCDLKPFVKRSELYRHYSTDHFSRRLNQFINKKERTCTICGVVIHKLRNLLRHVGSTHDKVEEFLDPSLHVSKGSKSSDHECHLCQKRYSARYNLKTHQALCHFKEEFKQFIDEKKLQCKICHLKFANKSNLQIHVGVIHKKLDEVLQQSTPSLEQGARQSLDPLDLDLHLSSDEDFEEPEISQGDIDREREEDKIEDQNEEENKQEKNSRKRLRVSEKGDQDYSQAMKRKIVSKTVVNVQEKVNLPNTTNVDQVSLSTKRLKEDDAAHLEGNHQDHATSINRSPRSPNKDEVDKSSDSRDEIDDLLSDSDEVQPNNV